MFFSYGKLDEEIGKDGKRYDTLDKRWMGLIDRVGARGFDMMPFEELTLLYSDSKRYYHNLSHIESCFSEFDSAKHLIQKPNELETAIWFHDAVYDTCAKDNEEKSAELAYKFCKQLKLPESFANNVYGLVLATKHNFILEELDSRLIADIDLAIFGKPEAVFDEYEKNIRKEYEWAPEEQFREGRDKILDSFLKRKHIYLTDFFRDKYEAQARKNLERSIEKLRKN